MKFKNPTEVTVRVSSTNGMVAVFAAGEEKEVPEALAQACLEERLTQVKTSTRKAKAAE